MKYGGFSMLGKLSLVQSLVLASTLATPTGVVDEKNGGMVKEENKEEVKQELRNLSTAYYAYGNALTIKEKNELLTELRKDETVAKDKVKEIEVESYDLITYLGSGDTTANLFSSVYIEPKDETGIKLEITNAKNITGISETQYINALTTSGATNVNVTIGSPIPVSGHSALVGVFKIFDTDGITLDSDRMTLAQDELNVVSAITTENNGTEEFNTEALNKALIEIKKDMNKQYDRGKLADSSKIDSELEKIINNRLADNGLSNVISAEQVKNLVEFGKKYVETGAVTDNEVMTNLDKLTEDVLANLKNKKDAFGNEITNKLQDLSLGEKFKEFFTNLFDGIKNFFGGIFGKEDTKDVEKVDKDIPKEQENEPTEKDNEKEEEISTGDGAIDTTENKKDAKRESHNPTDNFKLEEVDIEEGQKLADYEVEVEEVIVTAEEQLKKEQERIAKEKELEEKEKEAKQDTETEATE